MNINRKTVRRLLAQRRRIAAEQEELDIQLHIAASALGVSQEKLAAELEHWFQRHEAERRTLPLIEQLSIEMGES